MEKALLNRLTALFVGLALIIAFTPAITMAQQMTKIAGEIKAVYTKQDTTAVGDTERHMLSFAVSEGANVSTAEHEFMDGAQTVNFSFSDLAGGNGPHQGYVKFTKNGDSAFAKWKGKVTTTLSAEDTPVTTFEGTTTWIKGTGKFVNIQGTGAYKGGFTSKTEYAVAWEGEYSIKE